MARKSKPGEEKPKKMNFTLPLTEDLREKLRAIGEEWDVDDVEVLRTWIADYELENKEQEETR